ncbi:MAG: nuclear transport factor 2 family protein [Actinomycetota bacterium]|nr:nuclear transport factor 2 family protein [Actinomycetota bacterium]MDP9276637.1 nuclear transport factor 2 family protein [Actinomycetota bacterium]
MSQENEDTFRKAIEAAERGDPGALGEFMDPDLVVRPDPSGSKDPLKGRAEAVLFYKRACESGPPKLYVDDFRDLGDRLLFQLLVTPGHSEDENAYSLIVTFEEGRATLVEWFSDRQEAIEAAGLRE